LETAGDGKEGQVMGVIVIMEVATPEAEFEYDRPVRVFTSKGAARLYVLESIVPTYEVHDVPIDEEDE